MNKPANILYITHFNGYFTGAEQVLMNTIERLDRNKYVPHIIMRGKDTQGKFSSFIEKNGIHTSIVPFRIIELHKPWFDDEK